MDLSTQDCVKLYVSSDDSINPCPKHTSESSASAGHRSSWATVTGGSRHQSQRRNRYSFVVLRSSPGKAQTRATCVELVSLLFALCSIQKRGGQRFPAAYAAYVSSQGGLAGANMCPPSLPKHTQDSSTSTGHRSSYTTLLGALECQSERRKLDSFCCAPTVTCELVGLLLCTLQHCSMKKGCLQKCQAARSQLTSLQDFTLPHSTRLSYAKQLCQKRIPAFPSFEFR